MWLPQSSIKPGLQVGEVLRELGKVATVLDKPLLGWEPRHLWGSPLVVARVHLTLVQCPDRASNSLQAINGQLGEAGQCTTVVNETSGAE